jgi:DNA-directed RNA polymerase III subunit RPC3
MVYNVAFRFSKMATMVRERLGEPAAEVLHKIATLGYARVGDFADNYFSSSDHESMVNGDGHQKVKSPNQLHRIMDQLLHSGFLCVVTKQAFMPEYDIAVAAQRTEFERLHGRELKTSKEKKAHLEDIEKRKRKWRDDAHSHAAEPGEPASKRCRVAFLVSSGLDPKTDDDPGLDDGFRLPDDTCLRLNYDKCAVIMRNEQLVELAHRYIGETTSKVYAALLRSIEREWPRCYDPMDTIDDFNSVDEPPASMVTRPAASIMTYLNPALDLSIGIAPVPSLNGINGHNPDAMPPEKRQRELEAHLALLAADPRGFVAHGPAYSSAPTWTVPMKRLTRALQHAALSRAARTAVVASTPSPSIAVDPADGTKPASPASQSPAASAGTTAAVYRALNAAAPLGTFRDDRGLAATCVLPPRAARAAAARLARAGLVARQDIPRAHAPSGGGSRAGGAGGPSSAVASAAAAVAAAGGSGPSSSSRTLVLVAAAPPLARAAVTLRCVRAMVRLLARARRERGREGVRRAREKSERSDVRGREEELLAPQERAALERWAAVRARIAAAEARLDALIACLRDFGPAADIVVGPGTVTAVED